MNLEVIHPKYQSPGMILAGEPEGEVGDILDEDEGAAADDDDDAMPDLDTLDVPDEDEGAAGV